MNPAGREAPELESEYFDQDWLNARREAARLKARELLAQPGGKGVTSYLHRIETATRVLKQSGKISGTRSGGAPRDMEDVVLEQAMYEAKKIDFAEEAETVKALLDCQDLVAELRSWALKVAQQLPDVRPQQHTPPPLKLVHSAEESGKGPPMVVVDDESRLRKGLLCWPRSWPQRFDVLDEAITDKRPIDPEAWVEQLANLALDDNRKRTEHYQAARRLIARLGDEAMTPDQRARFTGKA